MNKFGIIVKKYLIDYNLKQQYIAEKLGLSKNSISQTLTRENISLSTMESIAEALNCDLDIQLVPKDNNNK